MTTIVSTIKNFLSGFRSAHRALTVALWQLSLAGLISLVAAGCSKQATSSAGAKQNAAKSRALKIGVSFQELGNPYFAVMKQALDEATRSIGAELYLTDARHDVTKQINDIEDLVQKGIDILLINPTDSVGIESAVRSANKAEVVVVAVDAQANGPIDSFVGSKNYDAGLLAGEALTKSLDGRGNVAILDGIPVVQILERVRGFKDAIAKHPGLKLVMMEIPRGIALLYTGGYPQSGLPQPFAVLGRGEIFGLQMPILIMLAVFAAAFVLLRYFPTGRYFSGLGGNEEAVRLSGVRVERYKFLAYTLSGITVAINGLVLSSRLMSGQPNAGMGFELDAMTGGRGLIVGTLIGALTLGVLNNGLNLMSVSPYTPKVRKGVILLLAIYTGSCKRNR